MRPADRVILMVLDSVGIGALPDAAEFGDAGSNTVGNLARARGGLHLPQLERLGLGNLVDAPGVRPVGAAAAGAFGRAALRSVGKDTMTGHWEMVGIRLDQPFRTYMDGFPPEIIDRFTAAIGVERVLGNVVASGTEIIAALGEEHLRTGLPIVYTSADSVFQIAAHEQVVPVERLYTWCKVARQILQGEHRVGRVIARPFTGAPGAFRRTERRKDLAVEPPPMLLHFLVQAGLDVLAVGKIWDIFTGQGITASEKTRDNAHGLEVMERFLHQRKPGLIFANLVDFDQLYGHRRDVAGYAAALEAVDAHLPRLLGMLGPRDVLIVTADHGNDPTFPGTDHTREWVPVLVTGGPVRPGAPIGDRPTLADIGATVADLLGVPWRGQQGESFLPAMAGQAPPAR